MPDSLDLSDLVGPPRRVHFDPEGKRVYLLPRDISTELYLEILSLQDRPDELEDHAVVQQLHDQILELFQEYQPEMRRLPPVVSIPVLIQLLGRVYRAEPDPTPAKPARAKPRAKASPGTRTTRSPSGSRSSS
jgi:hypothetical protein